MWITQTRQPEELSLSLSSFGFTFTSPTPFSLTQTCFLLVRCRPGQDDGASLGRQLLQPQDQEVADDQRQRGWCSSRACLQPVRPRAHLPALQERHEPQGRDRDHCRAPRTHHHFSKMFHSPTQPNHSENRKSSTLPSPARRRPSARRSSSRPSCASSSLPVTPFLR